MAAPAPHSPFNKTLLTTLGLIIGIVSGSFSMWLMIEDRSAKAQQEFEARITAQVKKDMSVENRLTRLEERYEALKATVWANKQAEPAK